MIRIDEKFYLEKAYKEALRSPDPSNQNGAVVVTPLGNVVGQGCNEFLPNTEITDELLNNREKKLFYIEHSERNAIFSAVRNEAIMAPVGCTLVCPWFACSDCARAIVLNGITDVIGHKERMDLTPDRWKASVDEGLAMLENNGVKLHFWSGKLDLDPILVNGELWYGQ
jgi:deoxycytidylate deaminase